MIGELACALFGHPSYTYTREVIDDELRTVRTCNRCGRRSAHSGDNTPPFDYWYFPKPQRGDDDDR